MNRRSFLTAALATMAPLFLAEAFGADSPGGTAAETASLTALTTAWARARANKRPLFVIVIPGSGDRWERGQAWGEVLNYASDPVMSLLGSVEVVCASDHAFRTLFPAGRGPEPWFWVVGSEQLPAIPVPGTPWSPEAAPVAPPPPDHGAEAGRDVQGEEDAAIDARIALFSTEISTRISAVLRDPATANPAALAFALEHLRTHAPANTHWAHTGGCGTYIEDVPPEVNDLGIMCGMGYVPERSARILYFFDITTRR